MFKETIHLVAHHSWGVLFSFGFLFVSLCMLAILTPFAPFASTVAELSALLAAMWMAQVGRTALGMDARRPAHP